MVILVVTVSVCFMFFKWKIYKLIFKEPSPTLYYNNAFNIVNLNSHEDYIKKRLITQIEWFDQKSKTHKNKYHNIKTVQIVLLALLPFLAGLVDKTEYMIYLVSGIGVLLAILEGLLNLNKHLENWLSYRTKCEYLQKNLNYYQNEIVPYNDEKKLEHLIIATEKVLETEVNDWYFRNGKN